MMDVIVSPEALLSAKTTLIHLTNTLICQMIAFSVSIFLPCS